MRMNYVFLSGTRGGTSAILWENRQGLAATATLYEGFAARLQQDHGAISGQNQNIKHV